MCRSTPAPSSAADSARLGVTQRRGGGQKQGCVLPAAHCAAPITHAHTHAPSSWWVRRKAVCGVGVNDDLGVTSGKAFDGDSGCTAGAGGSAGRHAGSPGQAALGAQHSADQQWRQAMQYSICEPAQVSAAQGACTCTRAGRLTGTAWTGSGLAVSPGRLWCRRPLWLGCRCRSTLRAQS